MPLPKNLPAEVQLPSLGLRLLAVPPGRVEVRRAPAGPAQPVQISHPFYLGITPITQAQFQALMQKKPTRFPEAGPNAPVDSVSWMDANAFCTALNRAALQPDAIPPDWVFRLPTEPEWQQANDPVPTPPPSSIWCEPHAQDRPQAIAQHPPSRRGFYDLLGNVWEWCQDAFHRDYQSRPEGLSVAHQPAMANTNTFAARGGSWFNSPAACTATHREGFMPTHPGRYLGFRIALAPPDQSIHCLNPSPPHQEDGPDTPAQELYAAIQANDASKAKSLLGANPELADYHDEIPPPLHWAVIHDRPAMVNLLLQHGARIDRRDPDENATPMTYAVVYGHTDLIPSLAAHGADVARALETARRGARGAFENYGMPRQQFEAVIQTLQNLPA